MDRSVESVSRSAAIEDNFTPVGVDVITFYEVANFVGYRHANQVAELNILCRVHHLLLVIYHLRETVLSADVNLSSFAVTTLLRSNYDNTVSSTRTVDRSRSSILQYADAFDI